MNVRLKAGAHSHNAPSRLWICFIMGNKPFLAITLLQSSKALAGRLLPCLPLFERSLRTVTMNRYPNPFFMGTYTLLRLDGAVALSNRVPLITILEMHCGNVRAYIASGFCKGRGIRATLNPYISILTSTFSHEVSVLMDLRSTGLIKTVSR